MAVVTVRLIRVLALLLAAGLAYGQSAQPEVQTEPLKADDIMARVALNQDRIEALRKEYVYKQHIHIVTHKPGSRMVREETADYEAGAGAGGHRETSQVAYWALLEQRQICGVSRRAGTRLDE